MATRKETVKKEAVKRTAERKVTFEFPALEAREVSLAGDFNGWDIHATLMKKDKKGIWKATVPLPAGRYEYRFLADGKWENDPACSSCVPNMHGSRNCVRMVD